MTRVNEFGIYWHEVEMFELFYKMFTFNFDNHYFIIHRSLKKSKSGFEMIEYPLKFLSYGILISISIVAVEYIYFKIRLIFSRFHK